MLNEIERLERENERLRSRLATIEGLWDTIWQYADIEAKAEASMQEADSRKKATLVKLKDIMRENQ